MIERDKRGSTFGFVQDTKWIKILNALRSKKKSNDKKYKIANKYVYPNGIIGKTSDNEQLELVPGSNNTLARGLRKFVNSRKLFDILNGKSMDIPQWVGDQFVNSLKRVRRQRYQHIAKI